MQESWGFEAATYNEQYKCLAVNLAGKSKVAAASYFIDVSKPKEKKTFLTRQKSNFSQLDGQLQLYKPCLLSLMKSKKPP